MERPFCFSGKNGELNSIGPKEFHSQSPANSYLIFRRLDKTQADFGSLVTKRFPLGSSRLPIGQRRPDKPYRQHATLKGAHYNKPQHQ
jgi:hypothetical protein